jgi:DnaJ-domain-containing protein 1
MKSQIGVCSSIGFRLKSIALFKQALRGNGISLPSIHQFQRIADFFAGQKADRANRKQQKQEDRNARRNSQKKSASSYDDVANRRAEQARAQRERAKAKAESSQKSKSHEEPSGKYEQASQQEYEPAPAQPVYKQDTRTPYEILGVSPDASQAQIKKAYAILRSRYHPDKYSHMSEAFRREAAEEFKRVKESYDKCVE